MKLEITERIFLNGTEPDHATKSWLVGHHEWMHLPPVTLKGNINV